MRARRQTARRPPITARAGRWKAVLALVLLGLGLYALAGGEDGLYAIWEKQGELGQLEAQVAQLEAENDSLRNVLWRLENDLEYVEKVAREEYGMSKKGERVYRLRPGGEE